MRITMPTSASTSLPYGRGPLLIVASRPTFKPIAALFTQGHALPRHLASIGSWQCAIRCMRLRLRAAVPRGDDQQASGDGIDRQIDLVNEVLEAALDDTFRHPSGQTLGRRGRRSILEDGERRLLRAIKLNPKNPLPRLVLAINLMYQGRGRETEIPGVVMAALAEADFTSPEHSDVRLALFQMGRNGNKFLDEEDERRFWVAVRESMGNVNGLEGHQEHPWEREPSLSSEELRGLCLACHSADADGASSVK